MRIIKNLLAFIFLSFVLNLSYAFAWNLDHFEVTLSSSKAQVWEALDITIKAVDKAWWVIKDFDWSVLVFSESDQEAEFPNLLAENSYTFEKIDEWIVKFENGIKFKNPGKQDVYVYDINDETILWVAEVEIVESEVIKNLDIEILSPENGLTIWKRSTKVSWTTQKNHKVTIIINDSKEVSTTSNDEWIFEKEIWELKDWDNKLKAFVLNSDQKRVWESIEINLRVESSLPDFKAIKISPKWEMYPETKISIEVLSKAWLSEVTVILNDWITKLKEEWDWVYAWFTNAPEKLWEYYIDVILKDDLWHETKKAKAEMITVIEDLNAAVEDTDWDWIPDGDDNCKNEPNPNQEDSDDDSVWDACDNCTKIKNKNQEDENDNQIGDVCEDKKCTSEELDLAITWVELTELKTKSVLVWSKIKWAWSYNIYKKGDEKWKLEFIDNVKTPSFSINITWDKIKHDYFTIRATGKDNCWKIIKWEFSDMVKVQTWPKEVFILVILAFIISWLIIVLRRKRA